MPGIASGLLVAPTSLVDAAVEDGGTLPSLSLEEEAVLDSLALDRPSPKPEPAAPLVLPTVEVETAGEVCRDDEGLAAF